MKKLPFDSFPARKLVPVYGALALLLSGCGPDSGASAGAADTLTEAKLPDGRYISWKEHTIDDEGTSGGVRLRGALSLQMADFDKDGNLDIVSAYRESSHIRIAFGSDDPGEWFRLSLTEGAEAGGVADVAVADLNADGFADLVAACEKGHLLYLENPGGTVRGWRWGRIIATDLSAGRSFVSVAIANLNGDARPEIVAAYRQGSTANDPAMATTPEGAVSWFEIPDNPLTGAAWRENVLLGVSNAVTAEPVDLDGDGDVDLFAASQGEEPIFWLENLGDEDLAFQRHPIRVPDGNELDQVGAAVGFPDLNSDGRLDVVLIKKPHSLVWLEQPSDPAEPWNLHAIGTIAPDEPAGLVLADVNNDGRQDVVMGSASAGPHEEDGEEVSVSDPAGRVAWFENPADAATAWARHDISRRKRGKFAAFVPQDMDADGDVDFIVTRGHSGEFDGVFWLQQLHSGKPVKVFTPARESESEPLPLADGED